MPGVVPGFVWPPPEPLPPEPPPPLQPMTAAVSTTTASMESVRQARRRAGIPKKTSKASTAPPSPKRNLVSGRSSSAALGAVVATESVAVAAVVPVMLTLEGMEQVGGSDPPAGELVIAQERLTAPVKPLEGVTVMVEVLPVVAPRATVMLPLLVIDIAGEACTVTGTIKLVLSDSEGEVAVASTST